MTVCGALQGLVAGAEQGRAQIPTTLRVELGSAQTARWLTLATATVIGSCVFVTSLAISLEHRSMFGVAPIFDLNREASIPAAYSALLLLSSAILLMLIAGIERSREEWRWFYWVILSLGFVYLATDELVAIHEKLNRPLQYLLGVSRDVTTWVIIGALGSLAAGLFFIPFLRALPARHASRFIVAGVVYVGSAVGFETIATQLGYYSTEDGYDWATLGMVTLEEGGEMVGIALFVEALLEYLRSVGARLELTF
jgi:hypothetical protein